MIIKIAYQKYSWNKKKWNSVFVFGLKEIFFFFFFFFFFFCQSCETDLIQIVDEDEGDKR